MRAADRAPVARTDWHVRIFTDAEKRQLSGQVFAALNLEGVDFTGANLRRTRFACVNLRRCDFAGADLSGAAFIDCDLRGASFLRVVLSDTSFRGSVLIQSTGLTEDQRAYVHAQGGALQPWHVSGGHVANGDVLVG
jgi:uncharacterized protein YjbI with pentapeptide repeats